MPPKRPTVSASSRPGCPSTSSCRWPWPGRRTPAPSTRRCRRPRSCSTLPRYLSYVAARTTSIRLGTYVYLLGLRHPFVTARAFATLDWVSGGRAVIGAGAGWFQAEWERARPRPHHPGRPARRGHRGVSSPLDRGHRRQHRAVVPLRRGGFRAQAGAAADPDPASAASRRRRCAGGPPRRRLDRHDPHPGDRRHQRGGHPGPPRRGRQARPAVRGHGRRCVHVERRRRGLGGGRRGPPDRVAVAALGRHAGGDGIVRGTFCRRPASPAG